MSNTVRLPENVVNFAADLIEENAACLRESHSSNGEWSIKDQADIDAAAQYVREMNLVRQLRAHQ